MTNLWTWGLFVFCTAYGVSLAGMYVCIIIVIHKNRKIFDSSFFKLFCLDGYLNIVLFLVNFFTMRMTMIASPDSSLGYFFRDMDAEIFLNFCLGMRYHMSYVQYSLTGLVTLNRATVLYNYNVFEPLWKRFCTVIVVAIFVIPLIQTHSVFNYTAKFRSTNESSYSLVSDFPAMSIYWLLVPFVCTVSFVSFVTNLAIFLSLRKKTTSKQKKVNYNFICIMSITSIIQAIGSAMTASLVYFSSNPTLYAVCKACLPYVSELLTLVQPALLAKFSQATREKLLEFVGFPPKKVTVLKSRSLTT